MEGQQAVQIALSNTETIPGRTITQSLGVVTGSTVRAKHIGKDILAGFKNIVGGELKGYTELLTEARNQAIFLAKGKVIFCLDDDSFPETNTLQDAYEIFEKNDNVGLLTCGIKNYQTYINKKEENKEKLENTKIKDAYTWSGCGGFFLKELFDKYGPWDEDPPRMGYYEIMTMMWTLSEKKRIVSSNTIYVYHKVSNSGDGGVFRHEQKTLLDEIYSQYFSKSKPARTCVEVSNLPKGVDLEIDAIARIP